MVEGCWRSLRTDGPRNAGAPNLEDLGYSSRYFLEELIANESGMCCRSQFPDSGPAVESRLIGLIQKADLAGGSLSDQLFQAMRQSIIDGAPETATELAQQALADGSIRSRR